MGRLQGASSAQKPFKTCHAEHRSTKSHSMQASWGWTGMKACRTAWRSWRGGWRDYQPIWRTRMYLQCGDLVVQLLVLVRDAMDPLLPYRAVLDLEECIPDLAGLTV